jgi:hypothetical protein
LHLCALVCTCVYLFCLLLHFLHLFVLSTQTMALTQEPLSVDYRHVQHFQLDPSIKRLVQKRIEAKRRLGHHGVRNLSQAKNIHVANLKKSIVTYYFDYNTVEIVLIGCNIFLALVSTGTVLNGGQCLDVWMFGCLDACVLLCGSV